MHRVKKISDRLTEALNIRGIKPIQLSQMTGINKSQISHYISGYCEPKQDNFYLLANALNVDYGWLMGYDVPMNRETDKHLQLRENIKEELIIASDDDLEKILEFIKDLKKEV